MRSLREVSPRVGDLRPLKTHPTSLSVWNIGVQRCRRLAGQTLLGVQLGELEAEANCSMFQPEIDGVGAENVIRVRDPGVFSTNCGNNNVGNPGQQRGKWSPSCRAPISRS